MSDASRSPTPTPSESRTVFANKRNRNATDNNSTSQFQVNGLYGLDPYRWKDDDISLRNAAAQARLPFEKMTKKELTFFPQMAKNHASITLFLYYRNKILLLWNMDPLVELTLEDVIKEIPPPYNSKNFC